MYWEVAEFKWCDMLKYTFSKAHTYHFVGNKKGGREIH